MKHPDTSSELVLSRWNDGVKLIKPELLSKVNRSESLTLNQILNLPFSVYFDNGDHAVEKVNDICVNICGFESAQDAIGRNVFDFSTKETAMRSVINQKEIMKKGQMKIIEDTLMRKDDVPISFVGISFPWYSCENKIIGVFGCSIVLNHHSVAQSLSKLYQLGLLSTQKNHNLLSLTKPQIKHAYFTRREMQCVELILHGQSPKQMGQMMCLSNRTIEHYIANIKNKLDVSTKAEMIVKLNEWQSNLVDNHR